MDSRTDLSVDGMISTFAASRTDLALSPTLSVMTTVAPLSTTNCADNIPESSELGAFGLGTDSNSKLAGSTKIKNSHRPKTGCGRESRVGPYDGIHTFIFLPSFVLRTISHHLPIIFFNQHLNYLHTRSTKHNLQQKLYGQGLRLNGLHEIESSISESSNTGAMLFSKRYSLRFNLLSRL